MLTNSERLILNNRKIDALTTLIQENPIDQILDISENGVYNVRRCKQVDVKVRAVGVSDVHAVNFTLIKSMSILKYAIDQEPEIASDDDVEFVNDALRYWSKVHLGG